MKKIIIFNSLQEAQDEKKKQEGIFCPLHTDFVGGKVKVTFVNGEDEPKISDEIQAMRTFEDELLQKLDTKEINLDGIKELLKIKFGQESYIPPKTLLEKLRFWN